MFNLDKLIAIATNVANVLVPGSQPAIDAVEAIVDFARDIAPTLDEQDQAQLAAGLQPLLDRMNINLDQGIADLGGTGREG